MVNTENNNPSTSAQHPNKWLKWYHELCSSRKYRGISKERGYHVHHIIPKCDGGDNSKGNRVKLTIREHFIAHVLLAKGANSVKHWYAVRRMLGVKCGEGAITYRPRTSILATSLQKTSFGIAPGAAEKGRPKSKQMRERLSKTKMGKSLPEKTLKKAHEANRGRVQTEEEKEKRSESAKKYWADKEKSETHRQIAREHMAKLRKKNRGEDIV
jgi:hypothetical protein